MGKAYCKSNCGMDAFNNRWSCPICGKELRPFDLRLDDYVERIVIETDELALEEVRIELDGSWKSVCPVEKVESRSPRKEVSSDKEKGKANEEEKKRAKEKAGNKKETDEGKDKHKEKVKDKKKRKDKKKAKQKNKQKGKEKESSRE